MSKGTGSEKGICSTDVQEGEAAVDKNGTGERGRGIAGPKKLGLALKKRGNKIIFAFSINHSDKVESNYSNHRSRESEIKVKQRTGSRYI
jgi:predicted NUDIX family NTP pyrophosphohydrolase